jgi:hypothetical protein
MVEECEGLERFPKSILGNSHPLVGERGLRGGESRLLMFMLIDNADNRILFSQIVCINSVAELEKQSGVTGIKDLHRENIDHITIPSKQGKGDLKRVEEVFDCWFESGR